jgi:two-component system, chemotaxis family, sensor kinase CheA
LLPLADLSDVLGAKPRENGDANENSHGGFVVVMQQAGQLFGVIVDEVFDTEEIVVKPLASAIADANAFSGATILGDGAVIMIIDPAAISQKIGMGEAAGEETNASVTKLNAKKLDITPMVVFKAGSDEPKAVPLSLVTRLEDLDASTFESGDGQIMVQYRGELMPIVAADPRMTIARIGAQPVLVFTHNRHAVGIAVDHIIDIVEEKLTIETSTSQAGILGVAVLRAKATEILDVGHYLTGAIGNWDAPDASSSRHIIMVERNPFFRNLLAPLLRAAGYEVEAVDTISAALLCAEYRKPSAVLADIDADGDAARRLLDDERLSGARIVAMSGSDEASASGFASLVRKSDRNSLIAALDTTKAQEIAA